MSRRDKESKPRSERKPSPDHPEARHSQVNKSDTDCGSDVAAVCVTSATRSPNSSSMFLGASRQSATCGRSWPVQAASSSGSSGAFTADSNGAGDGALLAMSIARVLPTSDRGSVHVGHPPRHRRLSSSRIDLVGWVGARQRSAWATGRGYWGSRASSPVASACRRYTVACALAISANGKTKTGLRLDHVRDDRPGRPAYFSGVSVSSLIRKTAEVNIRGNT